MKSMINKLLKEKREIILYLIFGFLTTVISILVFALFTEIIPLDELIANIISFIIAVFFAFITNKKWVFENADKTPFFTAMIKFYSARLLTLLIEELILFIFITRLSMNPLWVKITSQLLIIILNFILSKIFVFKKKADK